MPADREALARALAEGSPGKPASQDAVRGVVAAVGALPAEYEWYLLTVGWVEFGPVEVFGTGPGVPRWLDVAEMARWEHDGGGLPSSLIPIYNDGAGNLDCIDVPRTRGDGTAPIVTWDHEVSREEGPFETAHSFVDWLDCAVKRGAAWIDANHE